MTSQQPGYSVSSLMVYEWCPFQYYVTAVLGIPPPINRAMRRGTSLHKVIADHFRQKSPARLENEPDIQRLFETFRRSRFNVSAVATEKPFTLHLDRGRVRGRIDVVLPSDNGGLELVDFKSGRAGDRQELARSLQLPLYALAVSRLYERVPQDLAYTYYYLGSNTEITFRPGEASFAQLQERVDVLLQRIQEGRFAPPAGCMCFACTRMENGRLYLPR